MQTLYAYQITSGSDDSLYFALTPDACRSAAIRQRQEMREGDPEEPVGAMTIYECELRVDLLSLLDLLNFPDEGNRRLLISKRIIELVVD